MTHAFLIIAHDAPQLLYRILKRLEADNHYIYVAVDKKTDIKSWGKYGFEKIRNCYFLSDDERVRVNWGGFSQIRCELQLLTIASKHNHDYYHLISGHDYPCRSNQEFDSFFSRNNGHSFMHFDTLEQVMIWRNTKYKDRVMNWNLTDIHCLPSVIRRGCQAFMNRLCPRSPILDIVGGWNWFSLHISVVKYVMDYFKANPKALDRFKYTSCSDELFLHTLLDKDCDRLKINKYNSLRFIEWHPKRLCGSLPLVLGTSEYDEIIRSHAFFCRKVSMPESGTLLDMLDQYASHS